MKRIITLVALLVLSQSVSGEVLVRPNYGSTLIGMNRNILERQQHAYRRGDEAVVGQCNILLRECDRANKALVGETVEEFGLAYYFSGRELFAKQGAAYLKKGIPSDVIESTDALIKYLDGVLLLEESALWTGKDSLELRDKLKVLGKIVASDASKAVLALFNGDFESAKLLMNSVTGQVSQSVAMAAEKAGVDLRSDVVRDDRKDRVSRALSNLVHPVLHDTALSDADFFMNILNLDYPGLEAVKDDVRALDFNKAKTDYVSYIKSRIGPVWQFDWRGFNDESSRIDGFDTSEADKAASNNLLSVGITHQFGQVIDWMANPTPDKYNEWTWHLSYHDWWTKLKDAYWATGDEKYARAFVSQMRSWIEQSPRPDFHGRVPYSRWRSIEAGMRTLNYWPNAFFGFLASPSFDDATVVMMVKSFYEHGMHLRAYYRSHNWLAKEMFGLFTIGTIFPEFKDSPSWKKFAADKMFAEQHIQLYPSGLQTELSPGYHVGTQRNMYGLYKLGLMNNYPFPDGYADGIEKTYDCFLRSIMPDGLMPANNDSWWTDGRMVLSEGLEAFPSRDDFRYITSRGKEGSSPSFTSTWMPWAGWAIMRSGWDEDALYAFFDVGPFGAGHQHEDKLSMILSAYGKRLVSDGATYAYDTSKWRQYIISSKAHNVSSVDAMDQNRRSQVTEPTIKVSDSPLNNRWVSNESFDFSEGWYREGFGPKNDTTVTQYRALTFVKDKYWLVFDIFNPMDEKTHNYDTWFHLDTPNYLLCSEGIGIVSNDVGSANIAVLTFRDDQTLRVICGQEDPEVQGWVSASGTSGYKCRPVATPTFSLSASGRSVMPYLLYPLRSGESLPVKSMCMKGEDTLEITFEDGSADVIKYEVNGDRLNKLSLNGEKVLSSASGEDPEWDDTSIAIWPHQFTKVSIPSSSDGSMQKAYMYKSSKMTPQPLIICLHTWSGGYDQKDPLVDAVLEKDWNYIHPDFRGANNNPDAMLSDLAVKDIEDAIRYALEATGANPDEIHVIGASGGGLATLSAFMNVNIKIKTFSAWASISDLGAWYDESVGRKRKYSEDIMGAVGRNGILDRTEAARRSPLYDTFPIALRSNSQLFIYEGVHDGYAGSVPITHSINMFNRLVGELRHGTSDMSKISRYADADRNLVSRDEIISLVTKRQNPDSNPEDTLLGRRVHFRKTYKNIHLIIFEGGHEELPGALEMLDIK